MLWNTFPESIDIRPEIILDTIPLTVGRMDLLKEICVDAAVGGELGMKCSGEDVSLAD